MPEYTFDIVDVATFHVTAPDYQTARRAAEGVMEFNVRDNTVEDSSDIADIIPVVTWELTCVAPRGKASLAGVDDCDAGNYAGEDIPDRDWQTFEEPLLDARRDLREALAEADEALGGDSNDAEHDALYSIRGTIAALLGDTSEPPDPYGDEEDE